MSRAREKKARVGLKAWLRSRDERSAVRADDEAGNTLVEVLLTTIIVGLASVAIMTSFATTIQATAEHRALATLDSIVATASQEAVSEIQQHVNLFTCPMSLSSYQGIVYGQGNTSLSLNALNATGYTAQITSVEYWNITGPYAGQFTTTCVANEPQQITVQVTSSAAGSVPITNVFDVADPLNTTTTTSTSATQLVFTTQPGNGAAGVAFSPQPVVRVEDSSGILVATDLSPVTLSLTSGSGTLSSCSGSESGGIVTFSGCTVSVSGTYTLTASDVTLPLVNGQPYTSQPSNSFTISGAPPSLVFVTQPVAGLSGGVMSTQPKIETEISVAGVWVLDPITATVTLTASGGVLAGCTNLTAVLGVVNVSGCTFAGLVGTYYALEASSSGLVPVQSNAISPSGPGTAARIAFTTQPSGVASTLLSTAFTTQPVVTVTDSAGNIVTGYSTAITLSMTSNGGTLTCSNKVVTPSNGVASYSGCHGSPATDAIGVTLTATSGSLTATSQSFNITGVASALVFTTQPAAGTSGTSLVTQPVVTFKDSSGNTVTSTATTVTLTTSGGTLSFCTGLYTTTGVVNVASCAFAGLVGTSYTMTATAPGGLSVTSAAFTPTGPGAATKLVVTNSPVAGASGSVFTSQPIVKVEDSGGNVVPSSATAITLTASGGTLTGCTNLTAVAGFINVANCTFAGLDVASGGSYTITASASPLSPATSSAFSPSGPGPAAQVLLSGCAASIVWNTSCTLSAQIEDEYNNVLAGNIAFTQASGTGALSGLSNGVATISGVATDTVTGYTIGSPSVVASITTPNLSSTPLVIIVTPAPQTISWTAPGTQTWVASGAGTFSLGTASDTSNSTVTFASSTPSVCSVSGTTATMLTAGTCTITPSATAAGNYALTSGNPSNITINQIAQATLSMSSASSGTYPTWSITLSTTGGSGSGAVTYSFTNGTSTGCAINAGILSASTPGTCLVTATKAADVDYFASSSTQQTVTFSQASQAITAPSNPSGPWSGTLSVATTATSGLTVSYTYLAAGSTATGCAVTSGGVVSATSAGTCNVTLAQAGNTNWSAATSITATATFTARAQTITAPSNPSGPWSGTLSVATTATSGLTVSYTYLATGSTATGCAVTSGGVVSATGVGTCNVTLAQAGNTNWSAATSITATATFTARAQTITWTAPGAQTWGSGSVTLGASGPLGSTSASFPGTTRSSIYTSNTFNDPSSFSTSFWFKTSTPGAIAGATDQQSSAGASNYDRQLWIDAAGHLVFGLYSPNVSGSFSEVTSPGVYDNGTWYQVVATYGPTGERLYVNGVLVASSAAGISGQNYVFYWHLGYADTTSWPDGSVSQYFTGSLAQAALYTSQLTQAQVTALYGAATASAESTQVLADSAVSYWPLTNSAGTTVFTDQSSGNSNTGYVEGVFSLGTATDSASTTVTFASSTPSVCTVNGTLVTELTSGTCTITPTAPAGGNYATTTGSPSNITIKP